MNDRQTQWVHWIHLAEWWCNSTYHTSTKISPFEALYGYPPPTNKEYVNNNFKVPTVKYYLVTSNEVIHFLKRHLEQVRNHMKQQVDTKITNREFGVGDSNHTNKQTLKLQK